MTIVCSNIVDEFRCPTKWEIWHQLIALLPRGRAWQTHEDVIEREELGGNSQVGIYELGDSGLGATPVVERLTVMQQFWAAYAEVLEWLHFRACQLMEEFWCDTTNELRQEWGVEYGFPDPCEIYDDLCEKVTALGGATCAYFQAIAARRGWSIECISCPSSFEIPADCLPADCGAVECECPPNTMWILVHLNDSPAWGGAPIPTAPPAATADQAAADCQVLEPCAPEIRLERLICLIEKYKPAHVRAVYQPV